MDSSMKIFSALPFLLLLCVSAIHGSDWEAPRSASLYDWRNTTWFGVSGGSITGPGLSVQHWGDAQGFRMTFLPMMEFNGDHPTRAFFAGGAYLHSINHPKPEAAGSFGFASTHFFWFGGGFMGFSREQESQALGGSLSGGVGVEFNRRASRWTIMAGLGPYYMDSDTELILRFYPTLEVSWHFGSPQRSTP